MYCRYCGSKLLRTDVLLEYDTAKGYPYYAHYYNCETWAKSNIFVRWLTRSMHMTAVRYGGHYEKTRQ